MPDAITNYLHGPVTQRDKTGNPVKICAARQNKNGGCKAAILLTSVIPTLEAADLSPTCPLLWYREVATKQLNRIERQINYDNAGWIRDPQSQSICRSRFTVVDDPADEAVITESVNRRLADRDRLIANDRHVAEHVTLNHNVTCWSMLNVQQRSLSVTALEVFAETKLTQAPLLHPSWAARKLLAEFQTLWCRCQLEILVVQNRSEATEPSPQQQDPLSRMTTLQSVPDARKKIYLKTTHSGTASMFTEAVIVALVPRTCWLR